jgi:hypothetical protein
MIQLAWRLLMFQKESALAVVPLPDADAYQGTRNSLIVAMALLAADRIIAFRDERRVGVKIRPA